MKYFLLLLTITILSCKENSQNQSFEGDIYVTLINVYNVRGIVPKEKIEEFRKKVINFNAENKSESEKKMNNYYKTLIDYNLFNKSNFQLKLKNGEIINVYVNDTEYQKLKKELENLNRDKEKIKVKFEGFKVSNGIYNRAIYSASTIKSVKKLEGKTDWKK